MRSPNIELDLATAAPDDLERSKFDEDPVDADRETVSRTDPLSLTVAAKGGFSPVDSLDVVGDGSERFPVFGSSRWDPATSVHPFDRRCKICDRELDLLWRDCSQRAKDGRWLFRGFRPVNCCEACYENAKQDSSRDQTSVKSWEALCPEEFRTPWDDRLGNRRLLNRVLQFDPSRGRGLLVHGKSDTCKTRIIWRLLRQLSEAGREWLFVEAIDLLDNIPLAAFTVPILVIDDLGNDVLTPAKEVRLLKLLRTRCNWHRPVIITTQFVGESLEKRFVETATAQAIIRRLRQFCDDVHATPIAVG
jgi:DNA replication protein DnaC